MPLQQSPPIRRAAMLGLDVDLRVVENDGWVMAPHWHDRIQVIGTIDGEGEALVGRHPLVQIPVGAIAVLPSGAPHTAYARGPERWRFYSLHLSAGGEAAIEPKAPARVLPREHSAARSLFAAVRVLTSSHTDRGPDLLDELRAAIKFGAPVEDDPKWRAIALELCAKENLDLPLADFAARQAMSPGHFSRTFMARFGISPNGWRLNGRLEQSLGLVRSGLRLDEVCERTGFRDPSHLARTCKRLTGLTPRQFRCVERRT